MSDRKWDDADGDYLMHLHTRREAGSLQAIETIVELRDGRQFRLSQDRSRTFVQFAISCHPSIDELAAKLQALSLPELQGTSIQLWHSMRPLKEARGLA